MKELNKFVADQNKWNNLFGNYRALDLKNAQDRQAIAHELDIRLSPENLTCDGELTAAQVRVKAKYLFTAAKQLLQLDPTVEIHEYY